MTAVQKPADILPLGCVDVGRLLPLVAQMSERSWALEDAGKENAFAVFHHTQHLVFRFIRDNCDPHDHYSNPAWVPWKAYLLPVINQAIVPYGFSAPVFPKVMLARLKAHSWIDRHRDGAGSNLVTHKIHVPLVTNAKAWFEVGGTRRHLEEGQAYEVNNIIDHGAVNDGDEDRIHLIFEVCEAVQRTVAAHP